MHNFTCHVTRHDGIPRRVQIDAPDRHAAMRAALAGRPGQVSCRPTNQAAIVLDTLGVRMSPFPLCVGSHA